LWHFSEVLHGAAMFISPNRTYAHDGDAVICQRVLALVRHVISQNVGSA
jgi:hypothetical protein